MMKTEYIKISINDKGNGWVEFFTYSLDSSKRGFSTWRVTEDGLECMVANDDSLEARIGAEKAKPYVEKALARKEQYAIAEITLAD